MQPVVGHSVSSSLGRYDSILINRLRIGHTRLTNSYLLKGESQPVCEACHSPLTVEHICSHFGRLHPLQCSMSDILWSGHTQGRFWKCCILQHHRFC